MEPADFELFARLRALRKTIAEREGVPAYAVFTNEQLAGLARARPRTLAAVGRIPGVGPARAILRAIEACVGERLRLRLRPPQIQRSERGVSFLGFRVQRSSLRLSRRRRRRYAAARRALEAAYAAGALAGHELQAGLGAALAITAHADARGWRQAELRRRLAVDA